MKQGTDWVYVKVSLALVDEMRSWSKAVQVRLEEDYNGDIALVSRDVSGQTLRELAKAL